VSNEDGNTDGDEVTLFGNKYKMQSGVVGKGPDHDVVVGHVFWGDSSNDAKGVNGAKSANGGVVNGPDHDVIVGHVLQRYPRKHANGANGWVVNGPGHGVLVGNVFQRNDKNAKGGKHLKRAKRAKGFRKIKKIAKNPYNQMTIYDNVYLDDLGKIPPIPDYGSMVGPVFLGDYGHGVVVGNVFQRNHKNAKGGKQSKRAMRAKGSRKIRKIAKNPHNQMSIYDNVYLDDLGKISPIPDHGSMVGHVFLGDYGNNAKYADAKGAKRIRNSKNAKGSKRSKGARIKKGAKHHRNTNGANGSMHARRAKDSNLGTMIGNVFN